MADEEVKNNEQVVEKKPDGEQRPALTEIEQKAASQGWVPQDEWDGDPDLWRPAKEFVDRGELFKKIDEQNRTIKEFKKTLEEFGKHHARVQKVEYERAKADLLKLKKEALNEGDADAVIDIDEKLALVRDAAKTADVPKVNVPDTTEENPVFRAWQERNSWYTNNAAMKAFADDIGQRLGRAGGISPTDLLAEVERQVKKEFAHKFNNPNREKAAAVEGGGKAGGKAKDSFTLTKEEEIACDKFIKRIPGYTREKYIEELKKVRS